MTFFKAASLIKWRGRRLRISNESSWRLCWKNSLMVFPLTVRVDISGIYYSYSTSKEGYWLWQSRKMFDSFLIQKNRLFGKYDRKKPRSLPETY